MVIKKKLKFTKLNKKQEAVTEVAKPVAPVRTEAVETATVITSEQLDKLINEILSMKTQVREIDKKIIRPAYGTIYTPPNAFPGYQQRPSLPPARVPSTKRPVYHSYRTWIHSQEGIPSPETQGSICCCRCCEEKKRQKPTVKTRKTGYDWEPKPQEHDKHDQPKDSDFEYPQTPIYSPIIDVSEETTPTSQFDTPNLVSSSDTVRMEENDDIVASLIEEEGYETPDERNTEEARKQEREDDMEVLRYNADTSGSIESSVEKVTVQLEQYQKNLNLGDLKKRFTSLTALHAL